MTLAMDTPREKTPAEEIHATDENDDSSTVFMDYKKFFLLTIIPLGMANCSDATEILCLSYILSDSTFESTILREKSGAALAGAIFAGMLVGGLLLTLLGEAPIHIFDKTILVGRRRTLILIGLAINSIAGFVSAFTSNEQYMILIRSIAGLGIGISVPPTFTLVSELSPAKIRGFCVSVVASFWMIGSIFVSVVALFIFSLWDLERPLAAWRVFALICALPSFAAFILVYILIPESPRYLQFFHQLDEAQNAKDIISSRLSTSLTWAEYGRPNHGDVDDPLLTSINLSHNPETQTIHTPFHERTSHSYYCLSSNFKSLRILYTDRSLTHGTTLPLNLLWFSLCFGSYGLFTWINSIFADLHLPNIYVQSLLFALANFPGNIVSAILVDRIGRKKLLVSSMLISALSLISLALFAIPLTTQTAPQPTSTQTIGIVLSACSFQACIICGWNMIDCLTAESFPTNVRNSGMALCTAWGRIGAMLAQYINAFLMASEHSPVAVILIASVFLLLGSSVPSWMQGEDMSLKPLSDFNVNFDDMEVDKVETWKPHLGENDRILQREEDRLMLLSGVS